MQAPTKATRSRPHSSPPRSRRAPSCSSINSPSNPTGAAYTAAELQALGAVLERAPASGDRLGRNVRAHLLGEPSRSRASRRQIRSSTTRTVTINGVSKAYAMTGWRIGYCGGPKEIVAAMSDDSRPVHLERLEHFPARLDRRAERRPGLRRRDEQGVQGAP